MILLSIIKNLDYGIEMTAQATETERTKCEVWTRVMGYHRPIDSWNKGKKQEYADRVYFDANQVKHQQFSCHDKE